MDNRIIGVFVIGILFSVFFPNGAFAHPGNTASDGCHFCRTNCDEWGVAWNERHCHNGSDTPVIQKFAPAEPVAVTKAPTKIPTPKVKVATLTPKPLVTPTPERVNAPTSIPEEIITPSSATFKQMAEITLSPTPLVKRKSFFQWFLSLFL